MDTVDKYNYFNFSYLKFRDETKIYICGRFIFLNIIFINIVIQSSVQESGDNFLIIKKIYEEKIMQGILFGIILF